MILSYTRLKGLLNSFYEQKNYFIKEYGFFHGAVSPRGYCEVDYMHAYTTRDDKITKHKTCVRMFPSFLLNGCEHTEDLKAKMRLSWKRHNDILEWYKDYHDGMELRLEVVQTIDDLSAFLNNRLAEEWVHDSPYADYKRGPIYKVMNDLADRKVIHQILD